MRSLSLPFSLSLYTQSIDFFLFSLSSLDEKERERDWGRKKRIGRMIKGIYGYREKRGRSEFNEEKAAFIPPHTLTHTNVYDSAYT